MNRYLLGAVGLLLMVVCPIVGAQTIYQTRQLGTAIAEGVEMEGALCVKGTETCGQWLAIPGGKWVDCTVTNFPSPGGIVECRFVRKGIAPLPLGTYPQATSTVVTPSTRKLCFPLNPLAYSLHKATTAMAQNNAITWVQAGCNGNDGRIVQLFTDVQWDAFWAKVRAGQIKSAADLDAWYATIPATVQTASEQAFWRSVFVAHGAVPPVVPDIVAVEVWKVAPIAAGTRPYGVPNSAGTGITKKGDVAVGTLCNGSARLNQTSYYAVPSKGAGMYAWCVKSP